MNKENYTSWIEIDLGAIENNIKQLMSIAKRPVMSVVKANAYGHGLVEVAKRTVATGASWCGVARLDEGLKLREGGITCPILVLGYTHPSAIPEAIAKGISVALYDVETAKAYAAQAQAVGSELKVHVKFDTGMGRIGVFAEEGVEFVRFLKTLKGLDVEGVFTHFARSDEPALETTQGQLRRFNAAISGLEAAGLRPRLVHASNSAATLYFPEAKFDMVRPGIAQYGLHPSADAPLPDSFRPALSWKVRLGCMKVFPAGAGIGYTHRYVTQKQEKIGVLTIGYADGFRRLLNKNFVLINGVKAPIVGGVCMDQCMVQLDQVPDPHVGDEVVLIGKQGNLTITAEDIAESWGTISHEVVTLLAPRLPRFYVG